MDFVPYLRFVLPAYLGTSLTWGTSLWFNLLIGLCFCVEVFLVFSRVGVTLLRGSSQDFEGQVRDWWPTVKIRMGTGFPLCNRTFLHWSNPSWVIEEWFLGNLELICSRHRSSMSGTWNPLQIMTRPRSCKLQRHRYPLWGRTPFLSLFIFPESERWIHNRVDTILFRGVSNDFKV